MTRVSDALGAHASAGACAACRRRPAAHLTRRARRQAKRGGPALSVRFGRDAALAPPPRHPALLRAFAGALQTPEWADGQLEALIFDAHGGPWLQALLTALAPDRRALPSVA